MIYQILGIAIIFVALSDVFLTVLYPRSGKNTISLLISKGLWQLFRWQSRLPYIGSKQLLPYCGAAVLITVVVFWVSTLSLGFAILIWTGLGNGIKASQGSTPTDFATALYYSGYTITTLGVGDLVPQTAWWRLITILEAALGFSVITTTITYLLSVYSSLTRRNTFALSLYHRAANSANAVNLLIGLKGFGQFELATQDISTINRDLLYLLESHHAYPVLHYFRFQEAHYSLSRMALICMDMAALIKTALHPERYQSLINSSAVTELEKGGLDLLYQIANSSLRANFHAQPETKSEWRQRYFNAIEHLQKHGIETVSNPETGADCYVTQRQQWNAVVVALAHYMDYAWGDIAPDESSVT